ncbi:MAG: hypothetical protein ABSF64_22385 [Bryobacteraceae bacterium]|jgi:hypothetical protein
MRFPRAWSTCIPIAALCVCAHGQDPPAAVPAAVKDAPPVAETKGIPPRAAPGDYQAHAPAGTVTVAAEFVGHAVPIPEGPTYTTEDYVAVETALYGPSGARLKISSGDFSLRIYAKKTKPVPNEPFGMVFRSLKDPEWEDANALDAKAKSQSTSINTGGKAQSEPPAPVHMPIPLRHAMEQRVEKAALPEGDRALPQAGLIFFPFHGKTDKIRSMELIYAGPAGTATLSLQP